MPQKIGFALQTPEQRAAAGRKGGSKTSGYAFAHGKVDPRVAGKKGGSAPKRVLHINGQTFVYPDPEPEEQVEAPAPQRKNNILRRIFR